MNYREFSKQLVILARPANFSLPLLQTLVGYALADGSLAHPAASLLVLMASNFLIHSGFTIANDLADVRGDRKNHRKTMITEGSPRDRRVVAWCAGGMVVVALLVAVQLPLLVQVCLWVTCLGSLAYNMRPVQLSHRPIGSIVGLVVLYGAMPLLTGYFLKATTISLAVGAVVFCWAAGRGSLSILKDFKDVPGDKATGKRTFLLRFGPKATLATGMVMAVIGTVGTALAVRLWVPLTWQLPYLVVMLGAAAFMIWKRMTLFGAIARANDIFHELLSLQLVYDGMIVVWLLLS